MARTGKLLAHDTTQHNATPRQHKQRRPLQPATAPHIVAGLQHQVDVLKLVGVDCRGWGTDRKRGFKGSCGVRGQKLIGVQRRGRQAGGREDERKLLRRSIELVGVECAHDRGVKGRLVVRSEEHVDGRCSTSLLLCSRPRSATHPPPPVGPRAHQPVPLKPSSAEYMAATSAAGISGCCSTTCAAGRQAGGGASLRAGRLRRRRRGSACRWSCQLARRERRPLPHPPPATSPCSSAQAHFPALEA